MTLDGVWEGWTESQYDRRMEVLCHRTVVANMRKGADESLIQWAAWKGIYVRIDRRSKWGNPEIIRSPSRLSPEEAAAALGRYREHLEANGLVVQAREELAGRVLGCWCHPGPCHGNVLAAIANGEDL